MWTSALWGQTATNTPGVRTQKVPTRARVSTLTAEMAKTAQVTRPGLKTLAELSDPTFLTLNCISPEPVKCRDPGSPDLGHREGNNFLMGGEVVFGCGLGYELVGPPRLHCLETGNWDNPIPYCRGEESLAESAVLVFYHKRKPFDLKTIK